MKIKHISEWTAEQLEALRAEAIARVVARNTARWTVSMLAMTTATETGK